MASADGRAGDCRVAHQDASIPPVSGLEAGLVPLRQFPLRKWFYASPRWYYHMPAQEHRLSVDPKFYELVDPALRELCRLLLEHGLATTPSCQGHFYTRARFDVIWTELNADFQAIHGAGLVVKDSETDEPCMFQDPQYALPWRDFDAFYADVDAHQSEGYIGVAVSPAAGDLAEHIMNRPHRTSNARIERDTELSKILGQELFGVYVNAEDATRRDAEWAQITDYFRGMLKGHTVTGAPPR